MPRITNKETQALVLPGMEKSLLDRAKEIARSQSPPLDRNVWLKEVIRAAVDLGKKNLETAS